MDCAIDELAFAEQKNITLDCFVRCNYDRLAFARLRSHCGGRLEQQGGAESGQDQRQRRTTAYALAEERHGESRQRHQRQHLQQCDHRLPSFPEGALKNEQTQKIGSAKTCLLQLRLPSLNANGVQPVHSASTKSNPYPPV